VLVADVPEPGYDVPYSLAKAALQHRAPDVDPPRTVVEERRRQTIGILRAAAGKFGADLVDPIAEFCDRERCRVESDSMPLYLDADHLTQTAALRLKHLFDPIFAMPPAAPQPVGR
jgi:SGNH domain-containing protein